MFRQQTVSALYRCSFGDTAVACSVLVHAGDSWGQKICHTLSLWQPTESTEERGHKDAAFEVHGCQQSSCQCVTRNSLSHLLAGGKGTHNTKRDAQIFVLDAPSATTEQLTTHLRLLSYFIATAVTFKPAWGWLIRPLPGILIVCTDCASLGAL